MVLRFMVAAALMACAFSSCFKKSEAKSEWTCPTCGCPETAGCGCAPGKDCVCPPGQKCECTGPGCKSPPKK